MRMFDVVGFIVQPAGAATANGPSLRLPSGSFSSVVGAVFSGTAPRGPLMSPCGLGGVSPCGLGGVSPCGLAMPAAWSVAPACGLAGFCAEPAPPPQSVAGGRSPLGASFLQDVATRSAIRRTRCMPGLYLTRARRRLPPRAPAVTVAAMTPWKTLATVATAEGALELRQRGEREFLIVIGGRVLMTSSDRRSEQALATLACAQPIRAAPRVLIGGLGMAYTLRAALDV